MNDKWLEIKLKNFSLFRVIMQYYRFVCSLQLRQTFAMWKTFFSLFVLLQFHETLHAFRVVTKNNHVLVGDVSQQLYARDWFNCIQACHDEPRCISYNYERSAGANGLCELNDGGVEDLCGRDKSLIYSVGFVFEQIRECQVSCFDVNASRCHFCDERALSVNCHVFLSFSVIF